MRARPAIVASAMTVALLTPAAPAMAFHHVVLPAFECAAAASGGHAGGTATAVPAHNPVFFPDLTTENPPLPPAGTPAEPSCPE